jgi:predicted RND superfamily exporter protein
VESIARFLVTRSKVVLVLTALTSLTAALLLFRMSFNPDVTEFLLTSSEEGRAFADMQARYSASDPITAMIERADGGLMTERAGLELVLAARDAFKGVEGVGAVGTLIPDDNPMTGAPFTKETLDNMPDGMLPYLTDAPLAGLMISENKKAVLAVIDPGEDPMAVGGALPLATMPAGAVVTFAGNPIIFAQVLADLGWFLLVIPPCVVFLLLMVFAANIGSRKLAVLAVVPAVLGSLWTFGLIFGLGHSIDLVTIIVPVWVIVMGSADGLHFVTHLQEAAARTDDKIEQTRSALKEVGVPMILTTISTAVGFLAMLTTGIGPMMQLGVFTASGITFAGIISFFFLPALLSRFDIEPPHRHAIGGRLTGALATAARSRVPALALFVGLAAFAGFALPNLHVNPDQLFFFKDDHPARTSFAKLSEAFGGATPVFGEFTWSADAPHEPQFERRRELSRELEKLPGVRRVFSLADVVDKVPDHMKEQVLSGEVESPMGKMVADDGMRFVLFPRDIQPKDMQRWLAFVDEHEEVKVITGQPILFDAMSRLVMRAQMTSLAFALALVALLLLAVYRKVVQTLIAVVPMIVTIAVLLGFLAASGIQLHLLTAIVSSIVIGVGIDYVIHLLAAVELARAQGPGYATRAVRAVGRPILANALGIAVGLTPLFLSPMKPHAHISMVMWVSMTVGALTTLLFVPALLPRSAVKEAEEARATSSSSSG